MNFRIIFFAVFTLFFALVSCKSKKVISDNTTTENPQIPDDSWMEGANDMLAGKTWKLVEINGTKITDSNKVKEAYIMFTWSDESVTGNTSCNTFNGAYKLMKGNKIEIEEVAASKMACNDNNTEKQFLEVLELVDNYSINANSLIFHSGRLTSIAKFKVVN